jgi:DNA-binding MarR family transcriptional regulator
MYNLPMKDSEGNQRQEIGFILNSIGHSGREVESRLDSILAPHGLSIAKLGVLKTLAQVGEPVPLE